jgi:dihydrolipoamide dehydrogenase
MTNSYDIIVIGGGPGGYVAAIRASQLGFKTAVIEKAHLGGICLNWGCIPTKSLLCSSDLWHTAKHFTDYGIDAKSLSFDIAKITKRSREVSAKLAEGVKFLMKKNNITVIEGHGNLNGKNGVLVRKNAARDSERITELNAKHIILATGASARVVQGLEPDGEVIWTYKEAMVPEKLPASIIIVGSGAIGMEFASFYSTLGSKVTVVEMADRILPVEDSEISKIAQKSFEKDGVSIHVTSTLSITKKDKNGVEAVIKTGDKTTPIKAEKVIVAAGIVPNTENLGLEGTKIKFERGHIKTDGYLRTDQPNVYAIGDVTMPPWLAHKASHEAVVCIDAIAGKNPHPIKPENIPGCTYCRPQIASIGLSEDRAKAEGVAVKIGRFPFSANGKAIAQGETDGLVKVIFDAKTGSLIGAHIIGTEATELIHNFTLGKTMEAVEEDFMHTIFPHPTLSEMLHEAALAAYGKALHV